MTNVLISYTSTDRPWAEWLAWVLEENGLTVATQAWDVPAGSNFVAVMEQAIADGQKVLIVLSEGNLRSPANQEESSWTFRFISEWMSESTWDANGESALTQQPVANSSASKQQRLEDLQHELSILQVVLNSGEQRLNSLHQTLAIETEPSVKFQLEEQIQAEEIELSRLKDRFALIDEQAFPAAQIASPFYNRQLIPMRVEDVKLPEILSTLVYLDLVNKSEVEAEQAILAALKEQPEGDRLSMEDAPTPPKETVSVDESSNRQLKRERRYHTVQFFIEPLTDDIGIEMMQVPAGTFLMGSPEDELEHLDSEGPQHEVSVASFFMGKYPVTQAQWRAVAALPQASRELNPDPSHFKGDQRPVEQVSWYDAVEFCNRLAKHMARPYRLPTEAEWEYACRAGTTTPFHFGETITTDLANYQGTDNEEYKWSGSYGQGPKGEYRQETTAVDHFGIGNAFGLCDMHGNVWEWCQDHWHENYEGAPTDGRVWLSEHENASRVRRGGSWIYGPRDCRSAFRVILRPDHCIPNLGFRVVCSAPSAPNSFPVAIISSLI